MENSNHKTNQITGRVPKDLRKANSRGLLKECDNLIFVKYAGLEDCYRVLRTKAGSNNATVIFKFETAEQAIKAADKIASAIGGDSFSFDPRK